MQGALLHPWVGTLPLSAVVVGDLYDADALQRALLHRVADMPGAPPPPRLLHTTIPFPRSKQALERTHGTLSSSPYACVWVRGEPPHQAYLGAKGVRQGTISKNIGKPAAQCVVCRAAMLRLWTDLLRNVDPPMRPASLRTDTLPDTYAGAKTVATAYRKLRDSFLALPAFRNWVVD